MIINKEIKIQNIYYMLAYAFSTLKNDDYQNLANENFDNALDLLAAILNKGVSKLIKKGLGKEYINETSSLTTVKGKINISDSIKNQSLIKKQLVCSFDEFSINTTMNQIIKTTINIVIKEDIKLNIKKDLKNLLMYFKEVDTLNPYNINWSIKFNRNNTNYQMLISICYLIINGLIQKDEKGDIKMQKFLDEKTMHRLYETFILEYYKKHYPNFKVSASHIPWIIEEDSMYLSLLPKMKSDIMITTKEKPIKTLIIDAKYYCKTMQTNYDKKTLHSNNLYQIFTYVKNLDSNKYGAISGMLLYAKTSEEITPCASFNMSGNNIHVNTLDLSKEFLYIKKELDKLIEIIN